MSHSGQAPGHLQTQELEMSRADEYSLSYDVSFCPHHRF